MSRNWRKFLTMPWPEQRLLVGTVLLLPCIDLALRWFDMRWTQTVLARQVPSTPVLDGLSPEVINRIVFVAASVGLYRATCLRRSLALWWLLERRGVACAIKIGTANDALGFRAHAWVEWAGGQSDSPESLEHLTVLGVIGPGIEQH